MAKLKRINIVKLPTHTDDVPKKILVLIDTDDNKDIYVLSTMINPHIHAQADKVIYFSDEKNGYLESNELRYVSINYLCEIEQDNYWKEFKKCLCEG